MKKEGGVYTVPCEVNGLKLQFILDTGASNVCISLTEVLFMLKNGYLEFEDFVGVSQAQIADGSIVDNTKIILREIKIGNKRLTNVEASVLHKLSSPLLLGQSAIQMLGTIQLNGDELVILNRKSNKNTTGKSTSTSARSTSRSVSASGNSTRASRTKTSESPSRRAEKLIEQADSYRKKGDYRNAIKAYKEAYLLDKSEFTSIDYLYWGYSCNETGDTKNTLYYYNYAKTESKRIKNLYVEKYGIEVWFNIERIITIFEMQAYISDKNFNAALTSGRALLSDMNSHKLSEGAAEIYKLMSGCYYGIDDNKNSIRMAELGIDYYIGDNYKSGVTWQTLENKRIKDEFIGASFYLISLNYDEMKNSKKCKEYSERAKRFGFAEGSDNPFNVDLGRSLVGMNKLSEQSADRSSTYSSGKSSSKTKKYSVGDLTIDVINNNDWMPSYTRNGSGELLYIKNDLSFLLFIALNGSNYEVKDLENLVISELNNGKDNAFVFGNSRRSNRYAPGGVEISFAGKDIPKMKGNLYIFKKGNHSYCIAKVYYTDMDMTEFQQMYNSIKI